jgi:Fanconi anemia group I protein
VELVHAIDIENFILQLKKYYEPTEDVNPPVKLDLCITAQGDQIYLTEPLVGIVCVLDLLILYQGWHRSWGGQTNI